MKRFLTLCLLASSLAASAQTIVIPQIAFRRVDDATLDTYTFGAGQCNDTITVSWSNTTTIAYVTQCSSNNMKVWSTQGECGTAPVTGDVNYDDIPGLTLQTLKTGSFTVKIADLPGFAGAADAGTGTCGTAGLSRTHRVCGSIEYATFTGVGCGTAQHASANPLKLVYDTQPPTAPVITSYAAQDQAVKLDFTVDSDTSVVTVEAKGMDDLDYRQLAETASSNATIQGKGLQNNSTYDVRLRAKDAAGNVSDPSASISVTPIKTLGFYGAFNQAGGSDKGCSTGLGLIPALVGLWALRRARKQARSNS